MLLICIICVMYGIAYCICYNSTYIHETVKPVRIPGYYSSKGSSGWRVSLPSWMRSPTWLSLPGWEGTPVRQAAPSIVALRCRESCFGDYNSDHLMPICVICFSEWFFFLVYDICSDVWRCPSIQAIKSPAASVVHIYDKIYHTAPLLICVS